MKVNVLKFKYKLKVILYLTIIFIPGLSSAKVISTILGPVDESNPLIFELLQSRPMQRLKLIDQSGPDAYFTKDFPTFTRYEHSIGVYALLKMVGAPQSEQIAGLLHDVSHTVFSHVGDIVYQTGSARKESYQDGIHEKFLEKMGVGDILSSYNLKPSDVYHKRDEFKALEQPYPDMNADRIEYNIHTGLVFKELSIQDRDEILNNIRFKDGKWYFVDETSALKLATLSSYYTRNFWGAHHNIAIYTVSSALLKESFKKGVISEDEFKYGTDKIVLDKIMNSDDQVIKDLVSILNDVEKYYSPSNASDYDVFQPIKLRAMNPYVLLGDRKLVRLTDVNPFYKSDFEKTKQYCDNGVYIKFNDSVKDDIKRIFKESNS